MTPVGCRFSLFLQVLDWFHFCIDTKLLFDSLFPNEYSSDGDSAHNSSKPLVRSEKLWHARNVWGLFNTLWGREQDPQLEDALKVQYLNDDWQHGGLFIAEANDNPQNDDVTIDVHRLRVRRRLALCRWLNSAISTCPSIKVGEKLVENTGGRGGILGSTVTAFSILNELRN